MTEPSISLLIYMGTDPLASTKRIRQRPIVILIYEAKRMTLHGTLKIWRHSSNVLLFFLIRVSNTMVLAPELFVLEEMQSITMEDRPEVHNRMNSEKRLPMLSYCSC